MAANFLYRKVVEGGGRLPGGGVKVMFEHYSGIHKYAEFWEFRVLVNVALRGTTPRSREPLPENALRALSGACHDVAHTATRLCVSISTFSFKLQASRLYLVNLT